MMYRYAGYLKADTGRKADLSKFADAKSVSLFAKDAMQWGCWEWNNYRKIAGKAS